MLIPIGQEESEVRRWPWVSIVLIALNTLIFVVLDYSPSAKAWEPKAESAFEELLDYWHEHPYLKVPADLVEVMTPREMKRLGGDTDKAREMFVKAGRLPPPAQVAAEQAGLDAIAKRLGEALRLRPGYRWGYIPARPSPVSAVTSLFLHGGWFHLLGNMLLLFVTGPFLEDVYGRPLFAALYLLGGVFAAFSHGVAQHGSTMPLVGASGAIAVVMGAFLIRLSRSRIRFLFIPIWFMPWIRWTFSSPAFVVLPIWLVEQFLSAWLFPDARVAWWAHIGGFAFGMAAALALKKTGVEEKYINPTIEKQISWQQHPALARAGEARLVGDWETARREIATVLAAEPTNIDAWTLLYNLTLEREEWAEVARVGERLLSIYVQRNETDLASALVDEAARDWRSERTVRFLVMAATLREKQGLTEDAYDVYEAMVAMYPQDPASMRALLKMADTRRQAGRPRDALDFLEFAAAQPTCVEPWRGTVQKAIDAIRHDSPSLQLGGGADRTERLLEKIRSILARPGAPRPGARPAAPAPPHPTLVPTAAAPAPPPAPAIAVPAAAARPAAAPARPPVATRSAPAGARGFRSNPALVWTAAGAAVVVVSGGAALLLKRERPAPVVESARPVSVAARASAPKLGTASMDGGPATVLISFQCPIAKGDLIVQRNAVNVLKRSFDFGGTAGGLIEESLELAAGTGDFAIWLVASDRTVNAYKTLPAVLQGGERKTLKLTLAGKDLAAGLE